MFAVIGSLVMISNHYTLNGIKSRTVGDGQYGTARFATEKEIRETYAHVPYEPEQWRAGKHLPKEQGLVVGYKKKGNSITALVDSGDIHCLMIGAAGVGKTANFLYPNIEYACASGMSFLTTDTKGDLFRNYAGIAKEYYGYRISILDLRNPTRSDGNNILTLVNKYMDEYLKNPENLAAKARAEKYAKITAKTIICSEGASASSYGQNAFFYDAAEGLLTSVILLIAEYCPPEKRHIISVFKLIQDLLAPSPVKNRSLFQLLMDKLPPTHKAKWFAGAALNSADQAMASVLSTTMSRLNAFLDSEMEQILCFESTLDTETFCREKSAIFIVLPEEDNTKYFMVSLFLQQLYREMFPHSYSIEFRGPEKIYLPIPGLPKKGVHQLFACAVRYPRLHVRMENYARLAMQEDEWYNNLSDESCAMPGTFAVFALGLEGPKWWRLVCDYLDRCDDEHSSLQEKFIHTFFKKYGFTAQSLPVLVHGVQSMQNLKPAKEFRTLIANEESLDALLEIKGHLEYYLSEESGSNKRALAYLWRDVLWAIWGTASENGGSKVIKTAPKELKEKYQQVFA